MGASNDPRGEQRAGRTVDGTIATASYLMQCAQRRVFARERES
jgi:hypothetical protein